MRQELVGALTRCQKAARRLSTHVNAPLRRAHLPWRRRDRVVAAALESRRRGKATHLPFRAKMAEFPSVLGKVQAGARKGRNERAPRGARKAWGRREKKTKKEDWARKERWTGCTNKASEQKTTANNATIPVLLSPCVRSRGPTYPARRHRARHRTYGVPVLPRTSILRRLLLGRSRERPSAERHLTYCQWTALRHVVSLLSLSSKGRKARARSVVPSLVGALSALSRFGLTVRTSGLAYCANTPTFYAAVCGGIVDAQRESKIGANPSVPGVVNLAYLYCCRHDTATPASARHAAPGLVIANVFRHLLGSNALQRISTHPCSFAIFSRPERTGRQVRAATLTTRHRQRNRRPSSLARIRGSGQIYAPGPCFSLRISFGLDRPHAMIRSSPAPA